MSENFTGLSPANPANPFLLPNLSQLISAGPVSVLQSPATLLANNPRVAATNAVTVGGTIHTGDVLQLTLSNPVFLNGSFTVNYTVLSTDSLESAGEALAAALTSSLNAQSYQVFATSYKAVVTVNELGPVGNSTVVTTNVTGSGHTTTLTAANSGVMAGGSGPVIAMSQFTLVLGPNAVLQLRPGQPVQLDPTVLAVAIANGANLI